MTSMVQLKCWLCPESFGTNKELKNHASSSKHSVMRVICPWCFDKQSDYRTSAELLKHVNRRHQYITEETKKGDFFSEGNGYWLSINPQDYRKVGKPNEYQSTTAITTRAAVERWVGKLKKAGCKTIDQWREGWDLAKEKTVPTYSPSRPIIPEARLRLMDLELSSVGHLAYLVDDESTIEDVWYKVEILPTVFGDRRSLESMMRGLQRKKTRTIPRNFEHLAGDRPGILRASAKELGIDEQHVGRIYRSIRAMSIPPMKRKRHQLEELEKELGKSDDIELREPETTSSQTSEETSTTDSQASEETTIGSQSPRESITTSQTPDISQTCEENTSQTPDISQTHEENTTSLTPAPEETNTNPTSEEPTTSQTSDTTTETSNQLSDHQPANQIQDDSPVEDTPQNMETDITFSEEMPSPEEINVKDEARKLLEEGVMPLTPPARREWGDVPPITLTASGQTAITWPPSGWQSMNEEEKLTAWTFAAMSLELGRGVTMIKDEGELLNRYAFLALPGTKVKRTEKNLFVSIRLANYNLLKKIYLGEMTEVESVTWVKVFRAAVSGADRTTRDVINRIRHVPLRLTKETE